jgi:ABC-type transporter Mla subunit MlaD
MAVRSTVRDAQRTIAALDKAHTHAAAHLDRVIARRAEAIAEQDRLVAEARGEVDRTVREMAAVVGVELTAGLLGRYPAEIRRLAKTAGTVVTATRRPGRPSRTQPAGSSPADLGGTHPGRDKRPGL